jgi:hypothetical protein
MSEILRLVSLAIKAAECPGREGPYGLYDYSGYEGSDPPHVVRDFRDPKSPDYGSFVFRSECPKVARSEYDRLTDEHIARAAVRAMRSFNLVYRHDGEVVHELRGAPNDIWRAMLDGALNAEPLPARPLPPS